MGTPAVWWSVFLASIIVGLFGDVAMKQAGIGSVRWVWFISGFIAYSATSVSWFFLLRTRTLSAFGTLYPVANALGLVLLGAAVFGDRMGAREWVGIALGATALGLLGWK